VHKLGAKIKKDYFFFWCRMEALIRFKSKFNNSNSTLQVENKENSVDKLNLSSK